MRTRDLIQITPAVSTLRRYPPRVNACKHASKEGGEVSLLVTLAGELVYAIRRRRR